MVSHNERITSLANIVIAPEQTVGASLNWSIPEGVKLPAALVKQAVTDNSLPENVFGQPTEPLWQFKFWHYRARVPGRRRNEREIISAPARHQSNDLVSFVYSVNIDSTEDEKGRLIPVGSVTFNIADEQFWWRFDVGAMQPGETDSDYLDRALAAHDPAHGIEDKDLASFRSYAIHTLNDVAIFAQEPYYNGNSIRDGVSHYFRKVGGYSMSARGGFWYLPRIEGQPDKCPLTRAEAMMAAVETASEKKCRFFRLTMPKDASTTEMASEFVSSGLAERINDIREKVAKIEEVTRKGQHSTRLEELASIRQDIALYRDILGLLDTDLLQSADEVTTMIQEQVSRFELPSGDLPAPEKPARTSTRGDRTARPASEAPGEAPVADAACTIFTAEEVEQAADTMAGFAMDIAAGEIITYEFPGKGAISLEEDFSFGYLWTLSLTASGSEVVTGFSDSIGDAIRDAAQQASAAAK
jgi:hypothetical protein